MEAANKNERIYKVHLGYLRNQDLEVLTKVIASNTTLIRLEFDESISEPWKEETMKSFAQAIKGNTQLEYVRITTIHDNQSEEQV